MKLCFIDDHQGTWPVRALCRALGASPSGYHAWRPRPEGARAAANRVPRDAARRLHARHHGRHGSPRTRAALRAGGRGVSRGRVERLMRRHGIRATAARRFRPGATDSRHGLRVAPNLLERRFTASAPDQVWPAAITHAPTGEGWLHPAAALGLATRKIVGWAMRDRPRAEPAAAALLMATQRRRRPAPGLVHRTGRGCQYASCECRGLLDAAGLRASMSRRGNCLDNAPMESFFHTPKVALVHQRRWATRD